MLYMIPRERVEESALFSGTNMQTNWNGNTHCQCNIGINVHFQTILQVDIQWGSPYRQKYVINIHTSTRCSSGYQNIDMDQLINVENFDMVYVTNNMYDDKDIFACG